MTNKLGQVFVLSIMFATMLAYQNCAEDMPAVLNDATSLSSQLPVFSKVVRVGHSTRDERYYSVTQGSDLSFYLAGYSIDPSASTPSNTKQAIITKLSPAGLHVWTKYFGSSAEDHFNSITFTTDGHLVAVGRSTSFGATSTGNDGVVMKISADGAVVWAKNFESTLNEEFYSVREFKVGSDTGYVVVGYVTAAATSSVPANHNALIMKLGTDGARKWSKTFGGNLNDYFTDVLVTNQGGNVKFVPVGYSQSFGTLFPPATQTEGFVMKITTLGDPEWTRTLGGTVGDRVNSIALSSNQESYILSLRTEIADAEHGGVDAMLVSLSTDGEFQRALDISTTNLDDPFDVVRTVDGGYVIGTRIAPTPTPGTETKIQLTKVSRDFSTIEWNRTYGVTGVNTPHQNSLLYRKDNGLIVAFEAKGTLTTNDGILAFTDQWGKVSEGCQEVADKALTAKAATLPLGKHNLLDTAITLTETSILTTITTSNLSVTQAQACTL